MRKKTKAKGRTRSPRCRVFIRSLFRQVLLSNIYNYLCQVNCVLIDNKYIILYSRHYYFDYQRPRIGHVFPFLIARPSVVQVHESANRKEKKVRPNIDQSKLSPLEGNVNAATILIVIYRRNHDPVDRCWQSKLGNPLESDLSNE